MEPTILAALFTLVSTAHELPPGLLSALCFAESSHKVKAMHVHDGGSDSIGVCQIKVATARTLGFTGTAKDLAEPKRNVRFAARYLRKQLDRYSNDIRKAVAAYNTGTFKPDAHGLPLNKKYVLKVMTYWLEGK